MRSIVGLWRWRRNPLCRSSDRHEALASLCAALLLLFAVPLVGLTGGVLAHEEMLGAAREQRSERHPARATVQQLVVPRPGLDADPDDADGDVARHRVVAYWTGRDGAVHTGVADAGRPLRPGERFRIWTDERGRITGPPLSEATASSQALLAGLVSAAVAAALVETVRRLTVRQLLRRRYAEWDAEWDRIGPDWGRTGSSN
ncbi:Rv1733c family protein [Streptomyces sp. NPDC054784]